MSRNFHRVLVVLGMGIGLTGFSVVRAHGAVKTLADGVRFEVASFRDAGTYVRFKAKLYEILGEDGSVKEEKVSQGRVTLFVKGPISFDDLKSKLSAKRVEWSDDSAVLVELD